MVKKLLIHNGEINAVVTFHAKCLSLFVKDASNAVASNILEELKSEELENEGDMRKLVENVLECSAWIKWGKNPE